MTDIRRGKALLSNGFPGNLAGPGIIRKLLLAIAAAVTVVSCGTPGAHGDSPDSSSLTPQVSRNDPAVPLKSESVTTYGYTLNALPSCEVGDASAIAINLADQPLRITGMTLAMTAGGSGRASYQVAAVRPGFIGEIATNFDMAVLAPYRPGPALDTLLAPQAAKGIGYVFIALLRVTGMHARSWAITGLTVHYQMGRHTYTAFFPQAIKLPPVNCSL